VKRADRRPFDGDADLAFSREPLEGPDHPLATPEFRSSCVERSRHALYSVRSTYGPASPTNQTFA
ncbi:hypothetical protein ACYOEI_30500, partial [Singulisphaera rosea]